MIACNNCGQTITDMAKSVIYPDSGAIYCSEECAKEAE